MHIKKRSLGRLKSTESGKGHRRTCLRPGWIRTQIFAVVRQRKNMELAINLPGGTVEKEVEFTLLNEKLFLRLL